ncbi:MAG: M48 family metallopeptidase [Clostridia bacterium]|nr:M48 family metallopeptidase [Clostridia bacterium]
MERSIVFENQTITYTLIRKKVKNINMRLHPDGKIIVSASKWVSEKFIDEFVLSKAKYILKAQEAHVKKEKIQYFTEEQICPFILSFCEKVYPYFAQKGIKYPEIKFRKMTSRWGSCNPSKGILTFNINLMYAPPECVRYVVWHEFTHFLQANHSRSFYTELEKVCPDWKICRKKLKTVGD